MVVVCMSFLLQTVYSCCITYLYVDDCSFSNWSGLCVVTFYRMKKRVMRDHNQLRLRTFLLWMQHCVVITVLPRQISDHFMCRFQINVLGALGWYLLAVIVLPDMDQRIVKVWSECITMFYWFHWDCVFSVCMPLIMLLPFLCLQVVWCCCSLTFVIVCCCYVALLLQLCWKLSNSTTDLTASRRNNQS